MRVSGARHSTLCVAMRDIACSDLIVDVCFDLAVAVKSVLASSALVRILYMVLHCAKWSAARTAVEAQQQGFCRRGAVEGSE